MSNSNQKVTEMDVQHNADDIVVKTEETESTLIMIEEKALKQEPFDQDSVEICHNVYDSFIDVVKHELCDENSEMEHISHHNIDKHKPPQPGTSLDGLNLVSTEPAIFATNDGNKLQSVKTEQDETIDESQQAFEIEIDAVPFYSGNYNYDTRDKQTNSNIVTNHETAALEQVVTQNINSFNCQTTNQYKPGSSASESNVPVPYPIVHNDSVNDVKCGNIVKYSVINQNSVKHSQPTTKEKVLCTEKKSFVCTQCQKQFQRNSHLVYHIRTHTGEKPYCCTQCDYKCIQSGVLTRHMRTHSELRPHACTLCEFKTAEKRSLVRHMKTHERPFTCTVCEYKTAEKSELNRHMKTHPTGFTCTVCEYKSAEINKLARHMKTHTTERAFTCTVCEYKSAEKSKLARHMTTHTSERAFKCTVCEYKSAEKSNLSRHMKTHSSDRAFACTVCEYKSAEKSYLAKHMKTHTSESAYTCTVCEYKTADKSKLARHMTTHTSERAFTCTVCEYKSAEKSNLVRHMKTHTSEGAFTCSVCEYKSAERYKLVRHMKKHSK